MVGCLDTCFFYHSVVCVIGVFNAFCPQLSDGRNVCIQFCLGVTCILAAYVSDRYLSFLFEFLLHLILERHCRYQNSKMDQEPSKLPKELYKMLLISQTLICPKKMPGWPRFAPFTQHFYKISGPPFDFSGASHPRYVSLRSTYSVGSLHHQTLFF